MNLTGRFLVASPHLSDGNFFRSVVLMLRHDSEGAFGLIINRPTERRFRDLKLPGFDLVGSETSESTGDDAIYWGGPVNGALLALHDLAGVGQPIRTADQMAQDGSVDSFVAESDSKMEMESAEDPGRDDVDGDGDRDAGVEADDENCGSLSIPLLPAIGWITGDADHLRLLHQRGDVRVRYVAAYSGWGSGQLEAEVEAGGWLHTDATTDRLLGPPEVVWQNCVDDCGREILSELVPGIRSKTSAEN